MIKEFPNRKQLDYHILKAVLNGCETTSQIRFFIRELLNKNNVVAVWNHETIYKALKNLVDEKYITRLQNDTKGFNYYINEEHKEVIKIHVNSYYELFNKLK